MPELEDDFELDIPQDDNADAGADGGRPKRSADDPPKVLVVDDVALMRNLMVRSLIKEGCDVHEARHGRQALELAKREIPDLIVLDSMMPVMSGPECLAELKADPKTAHIPVVMCTAKSEKPDVVQAVKRGAIDYIVKPFSIEVFVGRVLRNLPEEIRPPGC